MRLIGRLIGFDPNCRGGGSMQASMEQTAEQTAETSMEQTAEQTAETSMRSSRTGRTVHVSGSAHACACTPPTTRITRSLHTRDSEPSWEWGQEWHVPAQAAANSRRRRTAGSGSFVCVCA